jgi:hypothetical protein
MRKTFAVSFGVLAIGALAWVIQAGQESPSWHMNASIIEACSCPMFCQCYFNTEPAEHGASGQAGHGGHGEHGEAGHFCKFNNAFQVNEGHHGETDLAGAKFWVAGDLGGEFEDGEMEWAVVTFDQGVSEEQRAGIATALAHVYPVKWKSFSVAEDAKMTWVATRDHAEAKLDDGKTAEVVLNKNEGMTDDPIVISNLRYWGVPRHDGFVMMQNEVEAWRGDDRAFEYKGTNGFMITIDIGSQDVAAPAAAADAGE